MIFLNQKEASEQLIALSKHRAHSVLIEGPAGSGKTYLAAQYAKWLGIETTVQVAPKTDDIKSAIQECSKLQTDVVLIIENLDLGVAASANSILKLLEEPYPTVYIVITCRNMHRVPDTIKSRSVLVSVSPPRDNDIQAYAEKQDFAKAYPLEATPIWKCVKSFSTVDYLLKLNQDQLDYFQEMRNPEFLNGPITSVSWKVSHFADNTEIPASFVIAYLMILYKSLYIEKVGIDCLKDIDSGRIAQHVVLSKFLLEYKYHH